MRSSYIIGKNDPLTKNLNQQIKKRIITIPGTGNYYLQPIYVMDVVKIIFNSINSSKFSKKILDLVGPETITFKEFVNVFKNKNKVKIKKINLEQAYNNALRNPKNLYGIDDLNIMIGNFIGDHKKLEKISNFEFTKYRDVLKTSRLAQ